MDDAAHHPITHHAAIADDPVALAAHAIRLLDKKLADDYGVRLRMGAELEFLAHTKDKERPPTAKEFGVPESPQKYPQTWLPSIMKSDEPAPGKAAKDNWFPDSRRVAHSYKEKMVTTTLNGIGKFEVVLTHRPMQEDGTPINRSSLGLVREIEGLKRQIISPAAGYKPGHQPNGTRARRWQQFHRDTIDRIQMDAYDIDDMGKSITCGLHLNSSLEDIATGENLQAYLKFPKIGRSLQPIFHEGLYLLLPNHEGWERIFKRNIDQSQPGTSIISQIVPHDIHHYTENKVPAIDSNTHYAVMLQLLGTYHGLKTQNFARDADGYVTINDAEHPPLVRIRDFPHTRQLFQQGTIIRDRLNDLETGLGDRFCAAIAHTPPGRESSALTSRSQPSSSAHR